MMTPDQLQGFCEALLTEVIALPLPVNRRAPARFVRWYIRGNMTYKKTQKIYDMFTEKYNNRMTTEFNAPVVCAMQVIMLVLCSFNNPQASTWKLMTDEDRFDKICHRAELAGVDPDMMRALASLFLT